VPGRESGNLYIEWMYVNNNWEQFGSANIDLSGYATKTDTVLETTLSRGRKAGTTIGDGSFAFGLEVKASGLYSHAEGGATSASNSGSHAEGMSTLASGICSHAEGMANSASGNYSHAEGGTFGSGNSAVGTSSHVEGQGNSALKSNAHAEGQNNIAAGFRSHAEGYNTYAYHADTHTEGEFTIANGQASHVGGKYNVEDSYAFWLEWEPGEYVVGDKCKVTTIIDNETTVTGYVCKTANNDATFDASHWTVDTYMNYAEIIGNGTANNARSNARALDWDGNEHLMGDLYVRCNADSSGGTKLARIGDIQIDSTSILNNGTANIPIATYDTLGVIKPSSYGFYITNNG